MHDIGPTIYSHAQGMVANSKLMSCLLVFANDMSFLISCHIYLRHPLPICGFISFVQLI